MSDLSIRTVPASRSTSDHLSAASSPRRAPVTKANAIAAAITGSSDWAALISVATCLVVGVTSFRVVVADGELALAAGEVSIHPHLTPWVSAAEITAAWRCTEDGDSSSSHAE